MQEVGQPSAHAPQEMHSSLILKAIVNSSVKTFGREYRPIRLFYHIFAKNQEPFAKKVKLNLISRNVFVNRLVALIVFLTVFKNLYLAALVYLDRFLVVAFDLNLDLGSQRLGFYNHTLSV